MLRDIRRDRLRAWWIAMMANLPNRMEKGTSKRSRKGPVRMWEDTTIENLGEHWRIEFAGCTTSAQSTARSRKAIEDLIFKWKPPKSHLPSCEQFFFRLED